MLTIKIKCTPPELKETIEKEFKDKNLCLKTTKFIVHCENPFNHILTKTKFVYTITIENTQYPTNP